MQLYTHHETRKNINFPTERLFKQKKKSINREKGLASIQHSAYCFLICSKVYTRNFYSYFKITFYLQLFLIDRRTSEADEYFKCNLCLSTTILSYRIYATQDPNTFNLKSWHYLWFVFIKEYTLPTLFYLPGPFEWHDGET